MWRTVVFVAKRVKKMLQCIYLLVPLSFLYTLNENPEFPTCPISFLPFSSLLPTSRSQVHVTVIPYAQVTDFFSSHLAETNMYLFIPFLLHRELTLQTSFAHHSITLKCNALYIKCFIIHFINDLYP